MDRKTLVLPLLLIFFPACYAEEPPPPPASEPALAQTPPPPAAAADPFAPVSSRSASPPAGEVASGTEVQAPGAVFNLPEGWQSEPPSSSMRLAQAVIPGSAGPGQLTVFFFGVGVGGGLEGNLARWVGQVEPDPGSPPTRNAFTNGPFQVTWIEVRGTLKPSTMGTGPTTPQPGSALLGAVIEGPGGPWYFKATGPATTLDAERDAFLAMLRSVRPTAA